MSELLIMNEILLIITNPNCLPMQAAKHFPSVVFGIIPLDKSSASFSDAFSLTWQFFDSDFIIALLADTF